MSRLRISVVTPSFNHAEFIERTVRSVLDQRGDFDLEYRVQDGGSTDGTLAILQRYGDRLQWTSEPDQGQVDAINKGLRATTADIVGWLNSDDVLLPGALGRVAAAFAANPEVEWVHGRCEIVDVNDRPVRSWVSRYKHFRARHHTYENLLSENYISQMTAFWRRRVHDEIGYLDPDLPLAFDYEFWLRLAKRGDPVYLNDRIACFRWYESSKSGANFEKQLREAADISARHMSNGMWWTRWRKYAKNAGTLSIYRLLDTVRSATRREPR